MLSVPVIIQKHLQLIEWLISRLAEFLKDQRFLLADRIEKSLLDVLELLIEAVYEKQKYPLLYRVNIELDKARLLMRIAKNKK